MKVVVYGNQDAEPLVFQGVIGLSIQRADIVCYKKGDLSIIHRPLTGGIDVGRIKKGWGALVIKPEEEEL